ncbi:hydrolase [Vibrio galatheae]|uniref:Hydrolase n=1 Tax=Vibrio galatheae TaxID=579748 RepID=A0A0F4NIK5_9VIBR|nr:phosphoethanolamine--lipid A transferase [Vibrio galatheae]KJY82937.1 hydrolase [Vibrio galatheae]
MKRLFSGSPFSYVGLTALLAGYFALVVNVPVYSALLEIFSELGTVKIGFVVSIPVFFFAAFNLLFNLFSWPFITKPYFVILLVISAAVSYAGFNYGTLFDSNMVANIVETDSSEATAYLSGYSVAWMLLMGVLPALLLMLLPIEKPRSFFNLLMKKAGSMVASLLVIAVIAGLYYQDYASVGRNNAYLRQMIVPTQWVYSVTKYVNKTYLTEPIEYQPMGIDAKQSQSALAAAQEKPTLMVFVLGETARSQEYQANGYSRATNAYTQALNMVSFQDVASCGTATAVSVPCLFSSLGHDNYSREVADNQDNVLDILKRAKVDLFWLENDGGDKGVAKHITKQEIDRKRNDGLCNGSTCYDMALLENFDQQVDNMQGNRMVLMHVIGSHGPTYFQRYPREHAFFQPDCPRADIENCSVEQIRNSYDNTIRYTDYVIAQVVDKLKGLQDKYNTALVYVSDHGESIGENGLFLHGMPYALAPEQQTKVPLMVWTSPQFAQQKGLDNHCLEQVAHSEHYSHDNLFHSMLGIMDVETSVYQASQDIFAQCRTQGDAAGVVAKL